MGHLIVVTTPELEPGYRLAGVATRSLDSASEAAELLNELLEQPGEGDVVAVHEPFFNELPAALRRTDRLARLAARRRRCRAARAQTSKPSGARSTCGSSGRRSATRSPSTGRVTRRDRSGDRARQCSGRGRGDPRRRRTGGRREGLARDAPLQRRRGRTCRARRRGDPPGRPRRRDPGLRGHVGADRRRAGDRHARAAPGRARPRPARLDLRRHAAPPDGARARRRRIPGEGR